MKGLRFSGVIRVCFQPTVDAKFTSVAYPKATIANPDPETKSMLSCSTKKSVHTEKDQEGIVFKSDGRTVNSPNVTSHLFSFLCLLITDSSGNPWSVNCLNVMSSKLTEYVEQGTWLMRDYRKHATHPSLAPLLCCFFFFFGIRISTFWKKLCFYYVEHGC